MTVAFWCVLAAALLPYVAIQFVRRRDNEAPRANQAALTGRDALANGAHLNAFEAFPFFAFAVVSAQVFRGPNLYVDALAVAFVLIRLAHMWAYIAGMGSLRSALFGLGLLDAIAIFLFAAF